MADKYMNTLWIRWPSVVLVALMFATGTRAQDCDFNVENVCIEIPNGIPTPDRDLRVDVTVDLDVTGTGTVFYRPTGSEAYTPIPVTESNNTYSITIPAEDVTVRGLDVYGEGTLSTGEMYSYPEEDPAQNPIRVPVYLGSYTVPVELPAGAYRMVSIAADLGSATAAAVFEDDFGMPESARWRLAQYSPVTNRYDEIPNGANSFADGAAFWIITAEGGAFDIDIAESTNPDSLPTITLLPGYNQIGNPYAFPVAWDAILAASGLGGAAIGRPMAYDGVSPYVIVEVLEPWTGYFVENRTGQILRLEVPAREALGGGAVRAPETSYAVRVEARSEGYADLNNVVGFAPAAAPGRDGLDLGEPPPVGDHLRVSVVEEDERWMRSLKPERTDGAFWDLEVSATESLLADGLRRVALSLDEDGLRPSGFGLYVIDRDRGTALALSNGAFEIELSPDAPVRRLRLIAGTEAFARTGSEGAPLEPTAFALDPSYPNPFAAQTTIGYRLEARGSATLEVFDLLGRRVRVLVDGEQPAGSHTAEWDGRDGAGRSVSNGVYLIRLRTGDASATRRVSVLR
jgi:hypothetical protein